MTPGNHLLDGVSLTLNKGFDGAVRVIAYPAGKPERPRLVLGARPEKNTLDLTGDDDVRADGVVKFAVPPKHNG